jgi:predicted nucleic-acid-binding protein
VKIAVDTNVLVRALTKDDERQAATAEAELAAADEVAVTLSCLCELVWVLTVGYRVKPVDVMAAIRGLIGAANVIMNRPAAEAGLAMMDAGGDFADGVIAYEGRWLGADTFVSFDRKAVRILNKQGNAARLLS